MMNKIRIEVKMINKKNANAMAEVIYYLKGIKQEDIDKIPEKLIQYLNKNATKEYQCDFDYNKPLKELNLLDETRGIIGMICYNYWCITDEQKQQYLSKLTYNEQQYQEEMYKKYNPNNLFENLDKKKNANIEIQKKYINNSLIESKEALFSKIKNFIFKILHINK